MQLKRVWLAVILASLFATTLRAQEVDVPTQIVPNGCLVAATECQARLVLNHVGIWAKIVRVTYWVKFQAHAYCVFSLSNGDLYAYDAGHGSVQLFIKHRDIQSIERALRRKDLRIYAAAFLD